MLTLASARIAENLDELNTVNHENRKFHIFTGWAFSESGDKKKPRRGRRGKTH
jgi:hypothetical protein